jgi:hypothetical protein
MRGAEKSAPLQRFLAPLRFRRPPKDLADRMAARCRQAKADDGFARETFTQPRDQSARDGEGIPRSMAGGGVHERRGILARTARRQDRIHDAALVVGG